MKFILPFMLIGLLVVTSCGLQDDMTPTEDTTLPVEDTSITEEVDDILPPTDDDTSMTEEADDESASAEQGNLDPNAENMAVQAWDNIRVHYTGTLQDGTVFDSSRERNETLDFQVGSGQMIPWFDAGVVDMTEWETKTLTLSPEEAYGERDDGLTEVIPREELQDFVNAGIELEVGNVLPTQFGELQIVSTDEETITVDINHPLAWETLTFEVELVEIVR